MKHLIIAGAGGFGRETYNSARESIGYLKNFDIKGFLDDNIHSLDIFQNYPPVLGTIRDYFPQVDDVFVCAVGVVHTKKMITQRLLERGAVFYTLIHKTSYISMNVKIGIGCMILADTRIHCDATIGDYVTIQPKAIIGHDVVIGDWSFINSYADCGGMSKIGEGVTINTTSFVVPHGVVGDNATIGAGSVTLRKVKAGTTVFGVPAKPIAIPQIKKTE